MSFSSSNKVNSYDIIVVVQLFFPTKMHKIWARFDQRASSITSLSQYPGKTGAPQEPVEIRMFFVLLSIVVPFEDSGEMLGSHVPFEERVGIVIISQNPRKSVWVPENASKR